MGIFDRVKQQIYERRDRLLEGKINSIPSPFVRFRSDFLGIQQRKSVVVTSFTKGSKTQFTSFVFVFTPIFYAMEHPDQLRVRFFFYLLEETKEDMMRRFMSHLLYKLSDGRIEVSSEDLMSSRNDKPVPQEALDLMETEEFKRYVTFFEEHSEFSESHNPTGVFNECINYAKEHGTIFTKKKKYKDEFGQIKETDAFDYYVPDDPDEYKIIIVDHVSLLSPERGFTLKQTIDKLSEYSIILRDRYYFTPVLIQQQNTDNESMDAMKMNKLRPTVAGLADSKYTARDCTTLIGLFSPIKFELRDYHGYNIEKFRDNIRFAEIILNRGGQMGGMIALYFNGAVCDYKELPSPTDTEELNKWYKWLDNRRKKVKFFLLYLKGIFKQ